MATIKEYAEERGISYEAARRQVKRYYADIEAHIEKKGRTQYLDDEAVAFLDEKRHANAVVIINESKDKKIEWLERENRELRDRVISLLTLLSEERETVKQLQAEKIEAISAKTPSEDAQKPPEREKRKKGIKARQKSKNPLERFLRR